MAEIKVGSVNLHTHTQTNLPGTLTQATAFLWRVTTAHMKVSEIHDWKEPA